MVVDRGPTIALAVWHVMVVQQNLKSLVDLEVHFECAKTLVEEIESHLIIVRALCLNKTETAWHWLCIPA